MKKKWIVLIFLILIQSITGCSVIESTSDNLDSSDKSISVKDTREEIEGGYIEQSTFEDFIITFDSVMNYSAQYFVGPDNEYEYLKGAIKNIPLSSHYLSLISGELHGEGIVELNTLSDSSIIGKAGEFAPYIDLGLKKGTYTIYFKNQIILFLVDTSLEEAREYKISCVNVSK